MSTMYKGKSGQCCWWINISKIETMQQSLLQECGLQLFLLSRCEYTCLLAPTVCKRKPWLQESKWAYYKKKFDFSFCQVTTEWMLRLCCFWLQHDVYVKRRAHKYGRKESPSCSSLPSGLRWGRWCHLTPSPGCGPACEPEHHGHLPRWSAARGPCWCHPSASSSSQTEREQTGRPQTVMTWTPSAWRRKRRDLFVWISEESARFTESSTTTPTSPLKA